MFRGLVIWNVLLTLLAGFLLFKQLGPSGKKGHAGKPGQEDSLKGKGPFRMAYFEMDSVAANFDIVKEVKTELTKKEDEVNREMDAMGKNFQQKYLYYQNQAKNGTLTQEQSEAASLELKKMDDDMKARKLQLDQEYNDLMVRRQNEIKTKIETFLKEYNQSHHYSYIISYEQGLFYFRDTAYNITNDVVRGLNDYYKKGK